MIGRRVTEAGIRNVLATAFVLALVTGCEQGPYLSGYSYSPQPAVAQVFRRDSQQSPPLTALVSIIGVRRADTEHHVAPAVVVRLQLENNGPTSVSFDPGTLQLVTGTLSAFPPPAVSPGAPFGLSPGQRATVNATFPFPPGVGPTQLDLDNLRLRWVVRVDNFPVAQTALFERTDSANTPAEPYNSDVAY